MLSGELPDTGSLLLARTPPAEGTLVEIVDDVFLPLVRRQPGEAGA
jgi:hypothetical protein